MMKNLIFIIAVFLSRLCCAQEMPFSLTYESTMAGLGIAGVYDSYLSPLKYNGKALEFVSEKMQNSRFAGGKTVTQRLVSLELAKSYNPAGTAFACSGIFLYDYGMFYRCSPVEKMDLFAGSQAECLLGFIYNNRNGNNPATGKLHLNMNISIIASYSLNIKQTPLRLSYQLSVPFAGAMYSPEFGQSYYEMYYVADGANLIHFSSFHNYISCRNLISAEILFSKTAFRLGFLHSFYQTRVNHIDSQILSKALLIGFSRNFFVVPPRQTGRYKAVF
jgi:hypothetical protein